MAFTEFYMQTTGSDMNAGSTTADAASVTQTNGSWDITADTFIATAATPFSAVNVGDWASIYNDGVTSGAVYVAQVTSINNAGLSITLSTTAKYGTKPASGATGKSCKVAGAWASMAVVNSLFPSVAVPASTRVNIKAGAYANTSTTLTFASAGSTTAPIWWRGYNTTPGDIDTNNALTKPTVTFTTGRFNVTGTYQLFSNLDISGAQVTNGQVRTATGTHIRFHRCRIECTAANANGAAISIAIGSAVFSECWLKATSSAPCAVLSVTPVTFIGCTFVGGSNGITQSATSTTVCFLCSFNDCGGDCFRATSVAASVWLLLCTGYSAGSDFFEVTVDPTSASIVIAGCAINECAGIGINASVGTNTSNIFSLRNLFYSNSGGNQSGMGDFPSLLDLTDSVSSFVNAAGADLTLSPGSNGTGNGPPTGFENQSYTGHTDCGAVQGTPKPIGTVRGARSIGTY